MARSNRSGKQDDGGETEVAPVPSAPVVEVVHPKPGNMVLYNLKPNGVGMGAISTPMVITRVHPDQSTVDGVYFNTHNTAGTMGAVATFGVTKGAGESQWRFR